MRGLYLAKNKAIAVIFWLVAACILVALGSLAAVTVVATRTPTPEYASSEILPASKIEGITESMACIQQKCPESADSITFLNAVFADGATLGMDPAAPMAVEKTANWWTSAGASFPESPGEAHGITAEGSSVSFIWGSNTYMATFIEQGTNQVVQSLVRGPDVTQD